MCGLSDGRCTGFSVVCGLFGSRTLWLVGAFVCAVFYVVRGNARLVLLFPFNIYIYIYIYIYKAVRLYDGGHNYTHNFCIYTIIRLCAYN